MLPFHFKPSSLIPGWHHAKMIIYRNIHMNIFKIKVTSVSSTSNKQWFELLWGKIKWIRGIETEIQVENYHFIQVIWLYTWNSTWDLREKNYK